MAEDNDKKEVRGEDIRTDPKTKGDALMNDINQHGEIHMTVEEVAGEVEARKGQTRYESTLGLLLIHDGTTIHRFDVDSVVSWYMPMEVFHA